MALQNVEANITLDLYNHDTTPATVKAIQLDSETRYVAARLQNVGVQYDVDSGATVQLIVVRPDKVGVQITGTTFTYGDENSEYLGPYAELTQVALAVSGKMRGQFKITSGDQILRTEIFAISNGEALDASTDEWADEYDGYDLAEMATSIETNTADIATLEADVSQIKEDLSDVKSDFSELPKVLTPEETEADLYISDANGNVLAKFEDGHIVTKNFTSESIGDLVDLSTEAKSNIVEAINEAAQTGGAEEIIKEASKTEADLYICDFFGNVIAEFKDGHIKTKNFDSESASEEIIEEVQQEIESLTEDVSALQNATTGILYRNKDKLDGAYAICRWHMPQNTNKQFCLLVSGDVHDDVTRMNNVIEYFNAVQCFDAGIMLGDIAGNDFRNNVEFYTDAIKNSNKPWLTVIGNHDAGSGGDQATSETAYTNISELVDKFMTPNIQYADLVSGEYNGQNCYYYKDFVSQKIRMIVLNQYDYPSDYDTENNTFVYLRGYECYSQAQITWLCNVLLSTPTDYGVIVALHSYPAWMLVDTSHLFTSSIGVNTNTQRLIDYNTHGFIIEEIVNAFVTGSSLNTEFAYTVSGSWGSGVRVNVDFTSRGAGEFITYIGGHWHMPIVSETHKYGQKMFTTPCTGLSAAQQGDTPRCEGTPSEDNFCALAIDRTLKTVKLFQVGAHYTKDGIDRQIGKYSYATE